MRPRPAPLLTALLAIATAGLLACSDPAARVEEHRARGEALLAEGRHAEAIVEFKGLLREAPNDADGHYGLARAYLARGESRQAYWELQEVVRLDPTNHDARLQLARLLLGGGPEDREAALEQTAAVLADDDGRWQAWLVHARALQLLGRSDEARQAYEAARERAPEENAPLFLLAGFLAGQGERAEAEALYRELADREGTSDAWLALGGFLEGDRSGDADAEAAYRRAVELADGEARKPAIRRLATFLFARGRFDEAQAVLLEAAEAEPDEPAFLLALAEMYDTRGESQKAEELLARTAEARPDDPTRLLLLAGYRQRRGDLAGALEATEQVLALDPRNRRARLQQAELLLDSGLQQDDRERVARGRAALATLLAEDEGDPEALFVRARLHVTEGEDAQAVTLLRRVLDRRPDWAQAHLLLATPLQRTGDPNGARSALNRALELEPGLVDAQIQLARLYAQLGEQEQAVEVGLRALDRAPDNASLHVLVAESLVQLGQGERAADLLARIPPAQMNAETHYAVGRTAQILGRAAMARGHLERAWQLEPTRFETLRALLELDRSEGRLAESEARVRAAREAEPRDARLALLGGEVALRRGDAVAAESAIRRSIEIDPKYLPAYQTLAMLLVATGREAEVLATFQKAEQANPTSGVAHVQLAALYEGMGRYDEAISHYEDALRLDPSLVGAKNNLAFLLAEHGGDLDRALDLAQEAKNAFPDQANVADTLGWVLYKKGVPAAAIGYLSEAEQGLPPGDPQLGEIRLHLALAYEANGDAEGARAAVARALRDLEAVPGGGNVPPWRAELQALAERLDARAAPAPSGPAPSAPAPSG
jgi:tetratricopeptide (TPR) repeat protein